MARRLKQPEYKSTTERVAEHRERLKEAGLKRLDLSVTNEAFESLLKFSKANKLSYSEAAEQLFLAASAPVDYYTRSLSSNQNNSSSFANASVAGATINSFTSQSVTNNESVVEAFFKSQIANQKETKNGKEE